MRKSFSGIFLTGAALILATGMASAQMAGTTNAPSKTSGMNNTGVTGQLPGTTSGDLTVKKNTPAMPSSKHTTPTQRRSTMQKTMKKPTPGTQS